MSLTWMSIFCCFFVFTIMAEQKFKFQRKAQLDNRTCASEDLSFARRASNALSCLTLCSLEYTCKSVFFNKKLESCHACSKEYESDEMLVMFDGYQMYTVRSKCPDKFWKRLKNSCYKFIPSNGFESGVASCKADRGHAVYIETSEENEWIKSQAKNEDMHYPYIGLVRTQVTEPWLYHDKGTLATFLDFDADAGSGLCASINPGYQKWVSDTCDHSHYVICELET